MKTKLTLDDLASHAIGSSRRNVFQLKNKQLYCSLPIFKQIQSDLKAKGLFLQEDLPVVLFHINNQFVIMPFNSINDVPHQLKPFIRYWKQVMTSNRDGSKYLTAYRIQCNEFFKSSNDEYQLIAEIGVISNMTSVICEMKKLK
jgi:hypothetical protein